ncbi:MAG: serine hydrolase [candidate division Zixibacteria bacterium]
MFKRSSLSRVLLLLAILIFFSVNTVYFVESDSSALRAEVDHVYHFDFDNVRKKTPYINVKAAIAVNYDNGEVLYTRKADQPRPIASITKLMTAMIIVDEGVDLSTTQTISREDARNSSRSRLKVGYELTLKDLLYCALLNSDNRAARALARATCGSLEQFAAAMNHKAAQLGLVETYFVEPTGLDEGNVSTPHEVAKLLHYAYDYDLIANVTSEKKRKVRVLNRKNKMLQMANTNLLVNSPYKVLAGKTGFIFEADHCLVTLIQNREGERLTIALLGVPGDKRRFREARKLANWSFKQIQPPAALASN